MTARAQLTFSWPTNMASTPSIQNYFKKMKYEEISVPVQSDKSIINSFYDSCLDENLKSCSSVNCANEKQQLVHALAGQKSKLIRIQNSVAQCLKQCAKKEQKILILEQQIEKTKNVGIEQAVSVRNENATTVMYSTFSKQFGSKDLSKMRSIGVSESEDSTFVLAGIRSLYKNEMNKVATITVNGRSRRNEAKQKMTPEKLKSIQDIFNERLDSCEISSADRVRRGKKVNVYIKGAFANIVSTKAYNTQKNEEAPKKINELAAK